MGIDYVATGKGRGDEKGKIERSFRSVQHSPEFECMAGFVGHNVHQRQHLEMESSTKLEKLSGVATNIKGDLMWWWEAENWLDNLLDHKQAKRYQQHTQATAKQLQNIYRLLGKRNNKKVSKEGIRHRNTHYLSLPMWQHVTIGDNVQIIENIDNANTLYLYKNGRFICEITEKRELREGLTVEQIATNKKAYKQRVVKELKTTAKQAQKAFKGLQNELRDEYLELETSQQKIKQKTTEEASNGGLDVQAELRRLAQLANA